MNNLKLNIKTVEGETFTIDIVKDVSNWDLKVNVVKRSRSKNRTVHKTIFNGQCEDNGTIFIDPNVDDEPSCTFLKSSETSEEFTAVTYKIPKTTPEPVSTSEVTSSQSLAGDECIIEVKEQPKGICGQRVLKYVTTDESQNLNDDYVKFLINNLAHDVKKDVTNDAKNDVKSDVKKDLSKINQEEPQPDTSCKLLMRPKEMTYGYTHDPIKLYKIKKFLKNTSNNRKHVYTHSPFMVYNVNAIDPLEALRNDKLFMEMLPEMKRTPELIVPVLRKICNECPPMLTIIRDNEDAVLSLLTEELLPNLNIKNIL